jgi:hypothetical protein
VEVSPVSVRIGCEIEARPIRSASCAGSHL